MDLSFLATACPIAMMTFSSPDLDAVQARYEEHLGYQLRESGIVSPALAESWGAPAVGGRPYLLLGPESGARVYLRVVEGPALPKDLNPLDTYGWTTAEIIGKDAYTLSARLKASPFVEETPNRVIRLDFSDHITNFRVVGPDGEALYLSQVDGEVPGIPIASANSFVDKIVMTVNTSKEPRKAQIFYENLFQVPGIAPFQIGDGELHIVNLPGGCIVELDSPKENTSVRPIQPGELPPGMAIATYYMDSLDRDDLEYIAEPAVFEESPYVKRRAATLLGPSGELVELLEFKLRPSD